MDQQLAAEPRERTGYSANRQLRSEGKVPAVVYGRDVENENLQLNVNDVQKLLRQGALNNVLIELQVAGEDERRNVLIKDVQIHPVESDVRHVDFHQVRPEDRVQVQVPVELVGESIGVSEEGGIVDQPVRALEVDCEVSRLPEQLEVDVSELEIGDVKFIRDIDAPPGVTLLEDADRTVVSIQPPEEFEVEPTPAAAEEEIVETVEEAMEEVAEGEEVAEEAVEGEVEAPEEVVEEAGAEEEPQP